MSGGKVSKKNKKVSKSLKKKDLLLDESLEVEDEFKEEVFFNEDSYNEFIRKYNIPIFGKSAYLDNDINKEYIITPKKYRITSDILSPFELARVVAERAKQIENGSIIFVDTKLEHDPIKIAKMEIMQRKCPLKIVRKITSNIVEEYEVNEMILPFH